MTMRPSEEGAQAAALAARSGNANTSGVAPPPPSVVEADVVRKDGTGTVRGGGPMKKAGPSKPAK